MVHASIAGLGISTRFARGRRRAYHEALFLRSDAMPLSVKIELAASGLTLGWVLAEGCSAGPSPPGLLEEVRRAVQGAVAGRDSSQSASRRSAVRDLLRWGAYKPTGRGKPASEYLLKAAAEGQFPLVNALVDINNLVSLESLLPISLVDLDRAGTTDFRCRRGKVGESFVFNASGQVLDLHDLLLLARLPSDEPCATPVKDSQATKTHEGTTRVLGVIYGPEALSREVESAAARMASLVESHCGAQASWGLLPDRAGEGG